MTEKQCYLEVKLRYSCRGYKRLQKFESSVGDSKGLALSPSASHSQLFSPHQPADKSFVEHTNQETYA